MVKGLIKLALYTTTYTVAIILKKAKIVSEDNVISDRLKPSFNPENKGLNPTSPEFAELREQANGFTKDNKDGFLSECREEVRIGFNEALVEEDKMIISLKKNLRDLSKVDTSNMSDGDKLNHEADVQIIKDKISNKRIGYLKLAMGVAVLPVPIAIIFASIKGMLIPYLPISML